MYPASTAEKNCIESTGLDKKSVLFRQKSQYYFIVLLSEAMLGRYEMWP